MSAAGQTVGKKAKHLDIVDKIDHYYRLVDDLDRLLNQIRGGNDAKWGPVDDALHDTAKTPPSPRPSLAEFLTNEPDRLENINNHFQELLQSIRGELF